jgi:hypothetical protein
MVDETEIALREWAVGRPRAAKRQRHEVGAGSVNLR